jgi:1-acyl-sn-glycerol-3-phosphate acyltransferase
VTRSTDPSDPRDRATQRPTWLWRLLHLLCFLYFVPAYRFRAWGVQHVPLTGATLLVANHQSFLDPIVGGLPLSRRRFVALARKTLWDSRCVGWLITRLNAIPVDQNGVDGGGGDLKAMRACLDVLGRGDALVIYPEGARTLTGEVQRFHTGSMLLVKRAKPTVVPVAIEGAFEAWPRLRRFPRPTGRIGVMFGEPIPAEELVKLKPDDALAQLRDRIEQMRQDIARRHGS